MKTLVIANQKGGVGKTTLAAHVAYAAAEQKKRVLMVDMDRQGSLSLTFTTQPEPRSRIGRTNVWQTSSVPMRLFVVSVWMSSSATSRAVFGSGLPPVLPMSPPAQLTLAQ